MTSSWRRLVPVLLSALLAVITIARPAAALSCLPVNIADQVQNAHMIFAGTVGDTSGPWAVVNVDRYYKGTGPAKVTVKTDTTWGPHLVHGEQWLLFVHVDEQSVWNLGLCGASRPLTAGQPLTQEEMAWLGDGTEPTAGPEQPQTTSPHALIWGAGGITAVAIILGALRLTRAGRVRAK